MPNYIKEYLNCVSAEHFSKNSLSGFSFEETKYTTLHFSGKESFICDFQQGFHATEKIPAALDAGTGFFIAFGCHYSMAFTEDGPSK